MDLLGVIINVFVALASLWVGATFAVSYYKSEGSWWQRLLAASRESATILWNKAVILATGLITGVATLADKLDPGTAEQIKTILPPNWVAGFMVAVAVISIVARLRTLLP